MGHWILELGDVIAGLDLGHHRTGTIEVDLARFGAGEAGGATMWRGAPSGRASWSRRFSTC